MHLIFLPSLSAKKIPKPFLQLCISLALRKIIFIKAFVMHCRIRQRQSSSGRFEIHAELILRIKIEKINPDEFQQTEPASAITFVIRSLIMIQIAS